MSWQFPHFNDIPNPELVNFATYTTGIIDDKYCKLNPLCKNCIFDASRTVCAADSNRYFLERKALFNYAKTNHPEYLL